MVLDGGMATELERLGPGATSAARLERWASWALYQAPEQVLEVHRRYAQAGCDVLSTNTWSILETADSDAGRGPGRSGLPAWTDAARDGIYLARQAIAETGRQGRCAVGFCLNVALAHPPLVGEVELLILLWNSVPPDLVIVETLESLPDPALLHAIENVAATGLPVWVSFRRGGAGMCSADGSETADRDPGVLSEAMHALEQAGVAAVLVNCIPVERVDAALEALSRSTSLRIGCYPRLGRPATGGWAFDVDTGPLQYAELALRWRSSGASIIGGCCGVTPEHILGAKDALRRATEVTPMNNRSR